MLAIGVSFERGEFNTEVRTHIGYASTTVKKYNEFGNPVRSPDAADPLGATSERSGQEIMSVEDHG
jgi:hypothetical protein